MIKFKRQDGGASSSNPAREPGSLAYGEPAVASDGTIYTGDGSGKVKSLVKNAKRAFDAKNGRWQFVGNFMAESWILKESTYEQTAQVKCLDSDNVVMSSKAKLSAPSTSQTDDFSENENKLDAIGIINMGKCIPGDGEITIKCSEKPNVDLDAYWDAKLDGEYTEEEESMYVQNAFQYSEQAKQSEKNCEMNSKTSKSWAVGGTGIREDEDVNNAKFWCNQAQTIAQGALGWYETEEALQAAHQTGQNGQWAIIGTTDTIWIWGSDTSAWINSGAQIDLSNYYTKDQANDIFAPTNHASASSTYGVATASLYGHTKLSDTASTANGAASGVAATPKCVAQSLQPKSVTPSWENSFSNVGSTRIWRIGQLIICQLAAKVPTISSDGWFVIMTIPDVTPGTNVNGRIPTIAGGEARDWLITASGEVRAYLTTADSGHNYYISVCFVSTT